MRTIHARPIQLPVYSARHAMCRSCAPPLRPSGSAVNPCAAETRLGLYHRHQILKQAQAAPALQSSAGPLLSGPEEFEAGYRSRTSGPTRAFDCAGVVCPAGTRLTWTGGPAVPDEAAGDWANAIEEESAISTCPKMIRILMIPSLPSELQDFRPTRRRHIQPEWVDTGLPFFRRRVQRDCERALPVVRRVYVSI